MSIGLAAGAAKAGAQVGLACRITDLDALHCSIPTRMQGSPNVFVEGKSWSCQGDLNKPHLLPCIKGCCLHMAPIATGATNVFVNGRGAGRVGDGVAGCTVVKLAKQSTVFAGVGGADGGAGDGPSVDPEAVIDERINAVFEGTAV